MASLLYNDSLSFGGPDQPQGQEEVIPFLSGTFTPPLLLHGSLVIQVKEARNLPDNVSFRKHVARAISMYPGTRRENIISYPYVTISLSNAIIGRTYVASDTKNPVWEQHFDVPVAHNASQVIFVVKHSDFFGSKTIGFVGISAQLLWPGIRVEETFPILETTTGRCIPEAVLSLSIQYTSVEQLAFYNSGVGSRISDPDHQGVPGTYFPLRKGGKVTLYQDAHVPDGCLPSVKLDNNVEYEHGSCWQDIYHAIKDARHLIYIAGWSLNPKVRLLRNIDGSASTTLGDLLKAKSQEKGVKVVLLVWEDPTSCIVRGGFMGTGDKEAQRFFEGSSVQFLLCPRSSLWDLVGKNSYTHHQKIVLVDADAGESKRKIIAFVGGLDLCLGRYDTPEHPLYRTLQTVHKDDYLNATFLEHANHGCCPREPWHDLHCKIEGPAAYDILTNFKQRWGKTPKRGDALLKIENFPEVFVMAKDYRLSENDIEAWNVQVFRSIDSSSVKGFPEDPKDAMNLDCGKNVLIDMSIQTAYVKAIRGAQRFIYIENQYFLGSSYNWADYKDQGINNLIPMEIALKIVNKIRAEQRFSVYIVIPMWPEGDPSSIAVQRILLWQNKTMGMMYEMIYNALSKHGPAGARPTDYLNFFCLGNREIANGEDNSAANDSIESEANSPHARVQKSRRFMIYVHSKGMIVDDEYVILGSANINQRSMGGSRDTEIAMGAYQPHHTWATKLSSPQGKVYGYRMSLWREHIGDLEECFKEPESPQCVQRVRTLSEQNWEQFIADQVTDMNGHLLKYPVECTLFPDVDGYILGGLGGINRFLPRRENFSTCSIM